METQPPLPVPALRDMIRTFGFWAVLLGAAALALVFAQIVGPSAEPGPSAAQRVGEIAGEIRRAAWRGFLGLPSPAPEPQPVPIWVQLAAIAPVAAAIAIVLSLISAIRGENRRYALYAVGLGASALLFQYLWWLALAILGVLLLIAIIENIGEIFGGFFDA